MKKILAIVVCCLLFANIFAGCQPSQNTAATESREKYLPVEYPAYYQQIYKGLFGKNLQDVAAGLGLEEDSFTLEMPDGFYWSEETVHYLGQDFRFGLYFANDQLGQFNYSAKLDGTPRQMAQAIKSVAETMQKMFGYDPVRAWGNEVGFQEFDLKEMESILTGKENWSTTFVWELPDDVSHIDFATEESAMNITLRAWYTPGEETDVCLQISVKCGIKAGNHLVRKSGSGDNIVQLPMYDKLSKLIGMDMPEVLNEMGWQETDLVQEYVSYYTTPLQVEFCQIPFQIILSFNPFEERVNAIVYHAQYTDDLPGATKAMRTVSSELGSMIGRTPLVDAFDIYNISDEELKDALTQENLYKETVWNLNSAASESIKAYMMELEGASSWEMYGDRKPMYGLELAMSRVENVLFLRLYLNVTPEPKK